MSVPKQKVTLMCDGKTFTVELSEKDAKNTLTDDVETDVSVSQEDEQAGVEEFMETGPGNANHCTTSNSIAEAANTTVCELNQQDSHSQPVVLKTFSLNGNDLGGDVKWPREVTLLLINERGKRNHLFDTPGIRKTKLWTLIAKKINLFSRSNYTGAHCSDKWRSLLQRYRLLKNKLKDPRHRPVTWDYFQPLDAIMDKSFIYPRTRRPVLHTYKTFLQSSTHRKLETTKSPKLTGGDANLDLHTATSGLGDQQNDFLLHRVKTSDQQATPRPDEDPSWLKKYLTHRKDEEDRRIARETRQREEDKIRWTEKKELEERKIAAIERLNTSIGLLLDKLK